MSAEELPVGFAVVRTTDGVMINQTEAARFLGVTHQAVFSAVRAGRLTAYRYPVGRKNAVLLRLADVQMYAWAMASR